MKNKWKQVCFSLLLAFLLAFSGCSPAEHEPDTVSESLETAVVQPTSTEAPSVPDAVTPTEVPEETTENPESTTPVPATEINLADIPAYSGEPYVVLENNIPDFTEEDLTTESYESYSELDEFGRCGVAYANIGQDLMPTEERGSIGQIKPSGWHTVKYDCVDGNYLYNRCHLIGYQLTAENANERNLITGTRYLNTEGMLPFENMVADFIQETGYHVLYRVTPVFEGNNLVASGVVMEAMSVEDRGEGILYHVYCYNVQPGVVIDYATGDSRLAEEHTVTEPAPGVTGAPETPADNDQAVERTYILNTNSHKFHLPSCSSVEQMSDKNREEFTGNRDELIQQGYEPCGRCNP